MIERHRHCLPEWFSPSLSLSALFCVGFRLGSISPSWSLTSLATHIESEHRFPSSCSKSPAVDSHWIDVGQCVHFLNALVARGVGGVGGLCAFPRGRRGSLTGALWPQEEEWFPNSKPGPLTWRRRLDATPTNQTETTGVQHRCYVTFMD